MIDWKKISNEILKNLSDQGKITQILSDFETDVTTFNTRFDTLEKQVGDFEGQVKSLQQTNMNLFLKLGSQTPEKVLNTTEPKLTYEDLLNNWDKEK